MCEKYYITIFNFHTTLINNYLVRQLFDCIHIYIYTFIYEYMKWAFAVCDVSLNMLDFLLCWLWFGDQTTGKYLFYWQNVILFLWMHWKETTKSEENPRKEKRWNETVSKSVDYRCDLIKSINFMATSDSLPFLSGASSVTYAHSSVNLKWYFI